MRLNFLRRPPVTILFWGRQHVECWNNGVAWWRADASAIGDAAAHSDEEPELMQRLRELRANVQASSSITVLLLADVVKVRSLELPVARTAEAASLLAREPQRFFPGISEPQIMAVRRVARMEKRAKYLVCAAPASLIAAIEEHCMVSGLSLRAVMPVHAAWAQALSARAGGPTLFARLAARWRAQAPATVQGFAVAAETHRIVLDGSEWTDCGTSRRVGEASSDAALCRDDDALSFAASVAPRTVGTLALESEAARARRSAHEVRSAFRYVGAAAALIALAFGFDAWRLQRDLDHVKRERAAIHSNVARITLAQDSLLQLGAIVDAASLRAARLPLWSSVIAQLTEHTPHSAYLTSLRGEGDSAVVQGVATSTAGVVQSLRKSPLIREVNLGAPIRRDMTGDTLAPELFTLGLRLRAGRSQRDGS